MDNFSEKVFIIELNERVPPTSRAKQVNYRNYSILGLVLALHTIRMNNTISMSVVV